MRKSIFTETRVSYPETRGNAVFMIESYYMHLGLSLDTNNSRLCLFLQIFDFPPMGGGRHFQIGRFRGFPVENFKPPF